MISLALLLLTAAATAPPAAAFSSGVRKSAFADAPWSPIDKSGPQQILDIVERKVQDGTIARSGRPDKFFRSHAYQQMYGMYLLPLVELYHKRKKSVKFLEIGLGCVEGGRTKGFSGMFSGLTIWKEILDVTKDEVWVGEYDSPCVDNVRNTSDYLKNINVVTGDQGDHDTLERWVVETGGNFDIIIDDGAHLNTRIYNSFVHLWPQLNPGGLYFIEDLHVVRTPEGGGTFGDDSKGAYVMADVIRDWIDQLMCPLNPRHKHLPPHLKHRLPKGVKWITCQMEACVIAKVETHDVARGSI